MAKRDLMAILRDWKVLHTQDCQYQTKTLASGEVRNALLHLWEIVKEEGYAEEDLTRKFHEELLKCCYNHKWKDVKRREAWKEKAIDQIENTKALVLGQIHKYSKIEVPATIAIEKPEEVFVRISQDLNRDALQDVGREFKTDPEACNFLGVPEDHRHE